MLLQEIKHVFDKFPKTRIFLGDFNSKVSTEDIFKHKFHMERFNLKKLTEVKGKEQCHVEVSDRFASLDTEMEIDRA
jgi:hypothetical protein